MNHSPLQKNQGFTLAEVLVASILLSIVMSAVYVTFFSTLQSWNLIERDRDLYRDMRGVLNRFERDLSNSVAGAAPFFEGEEKELTLFIVDDPMGLQEIAGRRLLRVRYRYDRGGRRLVREEALVKTGLPQEPPQDEGRGARTRIEVDDEKELTVAENVTSLSFAYIWIPWEGREREPGVPPPEAAPIIKNRHRQRWGLPQAIRLSLTFKDPEAEENNTLPLEAVVPLQASRYMRGDEIRKITEGRR